MSGEIVLLGDSAATKCTGLQTQYASFHARGIAGKTALATDLEYSKGEICEHEDTIRESDGCILAARILISRGHPELAPCSDCKFINEVNADPLLAQLRGIR